ncbi:MAG: hypothetical protein ACM3NV_02130 [Syntrophothermus sp.]
MRPVASTPDGARFAGVLLLPAVGMLFVALALAPGASAASRAAQGCGDVVVQFQPEGSGGAHAISAVGVSCDRARTVARSCVRGTVAEGWTATTWDGRVRLAKGEKRVAYTGVGGGGCGYQQQACRDFGYRGVGFFNLEAVGISCDGAKGKAKAWYDAGGACSFGSTCKVGKYRCQANPKTATIECRRQNGFRFRWQMGE